MRRRLPALLAALLVGLPLLLFIAYPLGAVLLESFSVKRAMTLDELEAVTSAALEELAPAERETLVPRWVDSATEPQRIEATAAALALIGAPPVWDRAQTFDRQRAAADAALAALDAAGLAAFEARYPVAVIMLHKRVPLAFAVRDRLSPAAFEALRNGVHSGFGLEHYARLPGEARLLRAAWNSLWLGGVTSLLTTGLAFLLAYGVHRAAIPGRTLVRTATLLPLASPPVIVSFAMILLFGREGLVTAELLDRQLGLIDAQSTNLYGPLGVVLAQVLSFLPAAMIIMESVLGRSDGRLEEAAAIHGAGYRRILWRVTLPLCQPAFKRSLVLVFMLSLTDFANPLTIGQGMTVLAGVLYDEIVGFQNTGLAAALAVWLLLPVLVAYLLLERLGRRKRFHGGEGSPSELPVPLPARRLLTAVGWGAAGAILLLYGCIVAGSFVRIWGSDWGLTLGWYGIGDNPAEAGFVSANRDMSRVGFSLQVALVAAPLGGLLAVVIAYLAERLRVPGRHVLTLVAMLPAAVPGVIFGIGYIVAFNLPLGEPGLALTGTAGILVLNILFANVFVGVLAARAALQRLDAAIDEAAEILGAPLWRRFVSVVLPTIWPAAMLGMLYVFVHGLTTLAAVIFLISPGNLLASYAIWDSVLNAYYGAACALSVALLAIVLLALGGLWSFERHGPAWARRVPGR